MHLFCKHCLLVRRTQYMIRKLIAFVLTAAMALSLLTVSGAGALEARAEGEIELSSLEDVVAALGSNTRESLGTKTYKLNCNILNFHMWCTVYTKISKRIIS